MYYFKHLLKLQNFLIYYSNDVFIVVPSPTVSDKMLLINVESFVYYIH